MNIETNPFQAVFDNAMSPKSSDSATKVRTKPVRLSVDIAPMDHKILKEWCDLAQREMDLERLPMADVVRELLEVLQSDKGLTVRVRNGLARRDRERNR